MIRWFPKTKLGKISLLLVIISIVIFYLQYWLGMLFPNPEPLIGLDLLIRIIPGFAGITTICVSGVTSIISIIKKKDKAILLFISTIIGLLGFVVILGELLIPH
ncbi:MAG: hypothetical protein AABX96_00635 [Nanoarchaeota archaeon]